MIDLNSECTLGVSREKAHAAIAALGIDTKATHVVSVDIGIDEVVVTCADRSELGEEWMRAHKEAATYTRTIKIVPALECD